MKVIVKTPMVNSKMSRKNIRQGKFVLFCWQFFIFHKVINSISCSSGKYKFQGVVLGLCILNSECPNAYVGVQILVEAYVFAREFVAFFTRSTSFPHFFE